MSVSRFVVLLGSAHLLSACGGDPVVPGVVTMLETAAPAGAGQAHLAGGGDMPLVLSWQESEIDSGDALRMSVFDGTRWGEAQTVATGENWFINWADFPSVVPVGTNLLIAHWLPLKPDERYAYDIAYALSADNGASWSDTRVLNADSAIAEHGFVSFFEWGSQIGAVWLDGREIAALTIDEFLALEEPVGMALRFARIDHQGNVTERGEIDELVCDCCQTDAIQTQDGPLIVYRDRTVDEVRDISVRHAVNDAENSQRWSQPVALGPDGWVIDGCPVNGPAGDAADEHVGVAWFTAADDQPRLRFARSRDHGESFDRAITIADENVLGQTDIVVHDDGTAWISAWHQAESGMQLQVHQLASDTSEPITWIVWETTASLPTDVPQMALAGDRLILAWSELGFSADNPGQLYSASLTVDIP